MRLSEGWTLTYRSRAQTRNAAPRPVRPPSPGCPHSYSSSLTDCKSRAAARAAIHT